ncbi:carbon storage regulator [Stieleria sp.]|uniref:carbon storage regulator n=1 Tax=Stieleria sp. TaxID=2795976 RepID=UPI003564405C
MLVLSRKIGEEILLGDDIRIVITRASRSRVSLAIDAPLGVAVRRSELSRATLKEFVGAVVPDRDAGVLDDKAPLPA